MVYGTVLPNPCVKVVVPNETAKVRLVCFPHAGGAANVFRTWSTSTLGDIEVCAVTYPGRAERSRDGPPGTLQSLAEGVAEALLVSNALTRPYAFFGHSFGALVAYETILCLARQEALCIPLPLHLFVSASPSPGGLRNGPNQTVSDVADDTSFLLALRHLGVLTPEAEAVCDDVSLQHDVLPTLLPPLRQDLALYEGYRRGDNVLDTPLTMFYGKDDVFAPKEVVLRWAEEHPASTERHHGFPGGHWYLADEAVFEKVTRIVVDEIHSAFNALPMSVAFGGDAEHLDERRCVHEMVFDIAEKHGDRVAVEDVVRGEVTYSALRHMILTVATKVRVATTSSLPVVGLMLPHSADYVAAMLGIWAASGSLLVLESHHPPEMLSQVCSYCSPSGVPDVIITDAPHFEKINTHFNVPFVVLDDGWEEGEGEGEEGFCPEPGDLSRRAILMTTSGTSGVPKLIEGNQRFVLTGMLSRTAMVPYSGAEREACSVMFVWEAPRTLCRGHTCVVIPQSVIVDPPALVRFLSSTRATRVLTTPSLASHAFAHLETHSQDLDALQHHLKVWFFMGEVVPAALAETALTLLPGVSVINAYSTWEGADTCMLLASPEYLIPGAKFFPVGRLHEGVHAAVVSETLHPVRLGEMGELYTKGPQLASGYAMCPEMTDARYVSLPEVGDGVWYKSGDAAVMRSERTSMVRVVELHGRVDSTVKIRGFKVGLPFVEGALLGDAAVVLAVVVPVLRGDEQPVCLAALLDLTEAEQPNFAQYITTLRSRLAQKIPRDATPTFFIPLDSLIPRDLMRQGGEARKVNRRAIPKLFFDDVSKRFGKQQQPNQRSNHKGLQHTVASVWADVLSMDISSVSVDTSFFDLGGHSLAAADVVRRTLEALPDHVTLTVIDLFENETLHKFCDFIESQLGHSPTQHTTHFSTTQPTFEKEPIAVIGMAGRFPGANDITSFWENLQSGTTTATTLPDALYKRKGVSEEVYQHKDYVKVVYKIDDADRFDAGYFGIGRTEATIMDPQHRVFIETAHHALEDAGYAPRSAEGREGPRPQRIGVFASAGIEGYLVHHLEGGALKDPLSPTELFLTEVGSEKDYISSRVSYLFDLHGPSVQVNSACSSGLVAISQACSSIQSGSCDVAIAGASSVTFPNMGHLWTEGFVHSKKGLVRPLDVSADGTVFGDSVGAVVLKRLSAAERDGDSIICVIQGSGISNDGAGKMGFAAPSAKGQADCIQTALTASGVHPDQISYVEMHATGTLVGDGIEAKGLSEAFTSCGATNNTGTTAVGSVKGNIGHANCAAGLTGFIKTALMLKHRTLVPSANFESLSDTVSFKNTPFYVATEKQKWSESEVLTAGVSSFGIGGTNAHIVVQEYRPKQNVPQTMSTQTPHVLLFSAKTASSLTSTLAAHAAFLKSPYAVRYSLLDVAFTLLQRNGDNRLPHRSAVTLPHGSSLAEAAECITDVGHSAKKTAPVVAFLFPGQGSQYLRMAEGLMVLPTFQENLGKSLTALSAAGCKVTTETIFSASPEAFAEAEILQPAVFAVEYAVAMLLKKVGVVPTAMIGHSLGEYVAAVVGNLISLENAAELLAKRSKGTASCPHGAMLSVALSEPSLRNIIDKMDDIWLAASNAPEQCVVSGTSTAINALNLNLQKEGIRTSRLHVTHAFHSPMVKTAAEEVATVKIQNNDDLESIPVASNLTGKWLTKGEAQDAGYWGKHMAGTVQFGANMRILLEDVNPTICIEVGPGGALGMLGSACSEHHTAHHTPVFPQSMRRAKESQPDLLVFTSLLSLLWEHHVPVNWTAWNEELHAQRSEVRDHPYGKRVSLPGYVFEKTRFWENPNASVYVEGDEEVEKQRGNGVSGVVQRLVHGGAGGGGGGGGATFVLYCFPFAGGSSRAFEAWCAHLPVQVRVVAVDLPGRGGRAAERFLQSAADDEREIAALASAIEADAAGTPYAFVGKSMGCLLALAVARALKSPHNLLGAVLAGRRPVRSVDAITDVPDSALASFAPRGVDATVWDGYMRPMLRADLSCDTRLERRLTTPSAPLPLLCISGTDDTIAPWQDAHRWQTSATPFECQHLPGTHSFLTDASLMIAEKALHAATGWLRARHIAALSALETLQVRPTASATPAPMYSIEWEHVGADLGMPEAKPIGKIENGVPIPVYSIAALPRWGVEVMRERGCVAINALGACGSIDEAEGACWGLVEWLRGAGGVTTTVVLLLPEVSGSGLLAGLTRAVPYEMPELHFIRVWVSEPTPSPHTLQHLTATAVQTSETDLSFNANMLAPRARRISAPPSPLTLPSNEIILITGWTGGLGRAVIAWMLQSKVALPGQMYLIARREEVLPHPNCVAIVIPDLTDSVAVVEALRNHSVDVSSSAVGVMHLAGCLQDSPLHNLSQSDLTVPITAKARTLDSLLSAVHPAWLLSFSSTSSLFGYPGQSNYCAANGFLDAYTQYGITTKIASISWGPWGEVGMAKEGTKAYSSAVADGDTPLRTDAALASLGVALGMLWNGAPGIRLQLAVCDLQWSRSSWRDLPILKNVVPSEDVVTERKEEGGGGAGGCDPALPVEERLQRWLLKEAAGGRAGGWEVVAKEDMASLGLDSLDTVQLRNLFNKHFQAQAGLALFTTPNTSLETLCESLKQFL